MDLQLDALLSPQAPRVFSPAELCAFFEEKKVAVSSRTVKSYLNTWQESGAVTKVAYGIFLNNLSQPRVLPDEGATRVRKNSVVSLQRVLGQCGALNNPSHWITCVIPYAAGVKDGVIQSGSSTFQFTTLHPSLFPKKEDSSFSVAFDQSVDFLRATPEKALLDWIYLATLPTGAIKPPPPRGDLDMDCFDNDKLLYLCNSLHLDEQFSAWRRGLLLKTKRKSC